MKKATILNEYITNQYPVDKFKKLISLSLDIVENFLLSLESGFNYNSIPVTSYSEKYGSFHRNIDSIFKGFSYLYRSIKIEPLEPQIRI